MKSKIELYNSRLSGADPLAIISFFSKETDGSICFANSMGIEDMIIHHIIAENQISAEIFTLDTGRLFEETYSLMDRIREKYRQSFSVYFPDSETVEKMVNEKGVNLFYESIENRKLCCHVRKILPLQRALTGKKAWITGLRRGQSDERSGVQIAEWDTTNNIMKINPLAYWSEEEVWQYIKSKQLPFNKLYHQGFRSIGCRPCTRAVSDNEDIRAGRWWWEQQAHKECGLHQHNPKDDEQ